MWKWISVIAADHGALISNEMACSSYKSKINQEQKPYGLNYPGSKGI